MSEKLRTRTGTVILTSLAAFALSFGLGACFDGLDAVGLPCTSDAQCGPNDRCSDGYCGGLFACSDGSRIEADHACDLSFDCDDNSDEDFALCFGDEASFTCDDGVMIPKASICSADGPAVCPDESDQDPILCAGVGVNQCGGQTNADLVYTSGEGVLIAPFPPEVAAAQFLGGTGDDMIVAAVGGSEIKFVFVDDKGASQDFVLGGMNGFGGSTIVDFELGDLVDDDDGNPDLVVATTGEDTEVGIHLFQNNAPMPPEAIGGVLSLPALVNASVVGIELGKLDTDDISDIVVIVDAMVKGRVWVAVGKPQDDEYYTFATDDSFALGYDQFLDSAMTDLDSDGDDDLLVSTITDDEPVLWIVERSGTGGAGDVAWDEPAPTMLDVPGHEITLGRFALAMAPADDIALLNTGMRAIQPVINMGGMVAKKPLVSLSGDQLSGLVMADMNCDGMDDFVFNVGTPAQVRVLLGDGTGGVLSADAVTYESEGTPRGGLAITDFDADGTPDIISAVDAGGTITTSQVRALLTTPVE